MSNIIPGYTSLKQSDFTIVNQDNRTITDGAGGINIYAPNKAGNHNVCMLMKTVPTAPYSFTVHLNNFTNQATTSTQQYGICLRDSASGKIVSLFYDTEGVVNGYMFFAKFTDATHYSTYYVYTQNLVNDCQWFRIIDDSTNRIAKYSRDGINWTTLYTVGRTDYITPDQIGLYIDPFNANIYLTYDHFKVDYTG